MTLDELDQLASLATPGPWEAQEGEIDRSFFQVIDAQTGCSIIDTHNGGCASDPQTDDVFFTPDNALFIAAANPAVIRVLVSRLKEAYAALNKIACWDEGPEVTSSFDDPATAKIARAALAVAGKPLTTEPTE